MRGRKKKRGRCWSGYRAVAGSTPYSKGSCVKEAYKRVGFVIAEYGFIKPDQKVLDARVAEEEARKKAKMAARAMKMNPKNPRYRKDYEDSIAAADAARSEADKPMTHEK